MYVPKHFATDDPALIAEVIAAYSFALLITVEPESGLPFVTHQPLLYDRAHGPHGRLLGHIARANPQWQHFASGKQALAVFQGPHAYISPSWYTVRPAVPTWNYAAVHAYGTPRVISDEAEVRALLDRLARTYEAGNPTPWAMTDEPEQFLAGMQRGIVAFEVPIERLEGKLKMSQNRTVPDRVATIAKLEAQGNAEANATAAMMRRVLPKD